MKISALERFTRKYIPVTESGCWLWMFYQNPKGYGCFSLKSGNVQAHRFSYENFIGPIPEGLVLDHICRVPCCVNPYHLRVVTNKENILSGIGISANNARKTHCKRGHQFNAVNTVIRHKNGQARRECRICIKSVRAKWRLRFKEANANGAGPYR